jgi:hypothetical protein
VPYYNTWVIDGPQTSFFSFILANINVQKCFIAQCWCLVPVILGTQKAEIRSITVRSQPGQIVGETLSRKKPTQKRAGGVTQVLGPELKPQYHKTKRKKGVSL